MKESDRKWLAENGYKPVTDEDFVTFSNGFLGMWTDREGRFCARRLERSYMLLVEGYATPRGAENAMRRLMEKYGVKYGEA